MDLSGISIHSVDAILQKMDVNSISRARQTNSSLDNYVEQRRFRQKTRSRNPSLVLMITIAARKEPAWSSVKRKISYSRKFDLAFSVASLEGERERIGLSLSLKKADKFQKIDDPYKQLSAVHFDSICLHYPEWKYGKSYEEIQDLKRKQRFAFCKILSHLEPLRLSCGSFSIHSEERIPKIEKILRLVSFSKICLECPLCLGEIEHLPIKHCFEIHCLDLCCGPKIIPPVLLSCWAATITSYKGSDSEEIMDQLLTKFIKDIQRSQESRGNLKRLDFEAQEISDLSHLPELTLIWNGWEEEDPATISKMKIDGGMAYLYSTVGFCDFHFAEKEDDMKFIGIIKEHFGPVDAN